LFAPNLFNYKSILKVIEVIIMNMMHEETPKATIMSNKVMEYWTNFAKTGNPNGDGLVP
jgi:carboxylesterase type B